MQAVVECRAIAKVKLRGLQRRLQAARKEMLASCGTEAQALPWQVGAGPQQMAAQSEADEVYYGGSAGGGKAQRLTRMNPEYNRIMDLEKLRLMEGKILTPFGFKALGDVAVGDQVCNPDGTVARVMALHDRGMQQFYRVSFSDGATTEVCGDHLWGYSVSGKRKRRKQVADAVPPSLSPSLDWNLRYQQRFKVANTLHLKGLLEAALASKDSETRPHYPLTPLTNPVNFTRPKGRTLMLPPYTMGVLLGDGNLTRRTPNWSKPDVVIATYIAAEVEPLGLQVNKRDGDVFSIVGGCLPYLESVSLAGLRSHEKFIPSQYLHASVAKRWELAQGLFDTDGHAGDDGRHVEYSSSSQRLALDVQWLVRSLGFNCRIALKENPQYRKADGSIGYGMIAYRLSISGSRKKDLFRLPRKRDRLEAYQYNGGDIAPGKRLVAIEPTVIDYARCLTVDNPNGLYITDDFIVTHNSALLLILAATQHRRSIIFRRVYPNLKGMIEKSKELLSGIGRYNSNDKMWRGLPGDRTLEFGAVEHEGDKEKYRGQEHDLKSFDELTEFSQSQFEFIIGWCRSSILGQKAQVVATFNPPTSRDGRWIIDRLAPWLDPNHPDFPAEPGELRWYIRDRETNLDVAVESGEPLEYKGELLQPRSRTFIPARLDDNPHLRDTNYRSMLQSMPEPLRSQLLYGDFTLGDRDDAFQVIPTAHVRAATARWVPRPHAAYERLGVDAVRGGADEMVIAARWEHWIDNLQVHPGLSIKDGPTLSNLVIAARNNAACQVVIDVVGIGASPYDFLKQAGVPTYGFSAGEAALNKDGNPLTDRTGIIGFANRRSYAWWNFREWLDPVNQQANLEAPPELPDDDRLLADLTTPRWRPVSVSDPESPIKVIVHVETKDEIKKRLGGRSPDRGDACVMTRVEWLAETDFDWIANY